MIQLVFSEESWASFEQSMLASKLETSAVILARVERAGSRTRLLAQEVVHPQPGSYRKRNTTRITLEPSFVATVTKRAAREKLSLVFAHTHPFDNSVPEFSGIDDAGEKELATFLERRQVPGPHLALVISPGGITCRRLAARDEAAVVSVGSTLRFLAGEHRSEDSNDRFDRQRRLLGERGQAALDAISIGVIGAGGTGSVVIQQLAYLGVKRFTIIDPDVVELSNLNRIVGATPSDVGRPKVHVARETVLRVAPDANVALVVKDVTRLSAAEQLLQCDLLFCCTDSHASRAVLNQIAYQYFIPCIDMGMSIVGGQSGAIRIHGRVQLLSPGQACLTCQGLIDPVQAREEMMTPEARARDPYFVGPGEPQPAVITVNSVVSSLATTMMLGVVAGLPTGPRHFLYDGINGRVRPAKAEPFPTCVVCSRFGALAKGSSWQLPVVVDMPDVGVAL